MRSRPGPPRPAAWLCRSGWPAPPGTRLRVMRPGRRRHPAVGDRPHHRYAVRRPSRTGWFSGRRPPRNGPPAPGTTRRSRRRHDGPAGGDDGVPLAHLGSDRSEQCCPVPVGVWTRTVVAPLPPAYHLATERVARPSAISVTVPSKARSGLRLVRSTLIATHIAAGPGLDTDKVSGSAGLGPCAAIPTPTPTPPTIRAAAAAAGHQRRRVGGLGRSGDLAHDILQC